MLINTKTWESPPIFVGRINLELLNSCNNGNVVIIVVIMVKGYHGNNIKKNYHIFLLWEHLHEADLYQISSQSDNYN